MALAACSGGDRAGTTDSAPPTTGVTSSPDAAADPSSPADSSAPSGPAADPGSGEKAFCASVKKVGDEMKADLATILQTGRAPTPAEAKKVLTDTQDKLTALAASGGDGKVVAAIKQFATEAAKAASAADPLTAADNPGYLKAGESVNAACRPYGVEAGF